MRRIWVLALSLWMVAAPATALPTDRAAIRVWESGGLSEDTLGIIDLVSRLTAGSYTVVHAGTLRMLSVRRGSVVVQEADPGYGFPMSASAIDLAIALPLLGEPLHEALADGQVVMSERSAALRGAIVGDVVQLQGWNGSVHSFEIGAVFPDAEIDWVEIAMSLESSALLGLDRPSSARIWGGDSEMAQRLLEALLPAAAPISVSPPGADTAVTDFTLPSIAVKERFGEFSFRPESGDGIEIDQAWVLANIVDVSVPRLGPFKCHRKLVPYLRSALAQVEREGLGDLLDAGDFQAAGGCYNARLIRGGDKGYALSRHAWGGGFDLNPSTNRYGDEPTLDPRIGQIFREWGFAWGAGWLYPDGMHFEWHGFPTDSAEPPCAKLGLRQWAAPSTGFEVYARIGACQLG